MPLYEVVILERPSKKEREEGSLERIVFGPKLMVAMDDKSAAVAAVVGESQLNVDRGRMEVLVRPF